MEFIKKFLEMNVNDHTEKKNGLTYLSWSWAWQKVLEVAPTATYTVLKNADGLPCFGNAKMGYMVYTTVTIESITHEMWLPVMDNRNKSILEPTTFDINKAVMRCLTKNLAMFGLGAYIYAGEDLPESETKQEPTKIGHEQAASLTVLALRKGIAIESIVTNYKLKALADMTLEMLEHCTSSLNKREDKA